MWQRLLNSLLPNREAAPTRAGNRGEFFIYHVEGPEGPRDMVSLLPSNTVFESGLPGEAVVGILMQPAKSNADVTADNFRPNKAFREILQSVAKNRALLFYRFFEFPAGPG